MAANLQQRQIRVFVSSTFRDMQAEREELAKYIFPKLRKLCAHRGVTFTDVDLAEAEDILDVALAEVENCRPFFIGLLGERYGWVPDQHSPQLLERHPWVRDFPGRSSVELEMLHGALNNPALAEHAFFYFRDPAYVAKLEPHMRNHYGESAPEADSKLIALKERVRRSGLPVRENYADPQTLGELVLADLTAVVERLYPAMGLDPLDMVAQNHAAYGRSLCTVFVGREADMAALDAHAAGNGAPLVLTGESGIGKSALIAYWAEWYRQTHPAELVVTHYIGGAADSTDWVAIVRRIMGELQRWSDLEGEIPSEPQALRQALGGWLSRAAAKGRILLVLDGLNRL
ncbi:MAG TPA: DUF4062 domain-containing protein, partial [Symbiobacteriaceae bacterium]|nr:DUF4062 domain-containing protein [Symbiobacteriaceae bacterium]